MRVTYNAAPLRLGAALPPPGPADLTPVHLKAVSPERARAVGPWVRAALDAVVLEGRHRHVVVDVKVEALAPGGLPCLEGWHCDTVLDPTHPSRPEVHHLVVTGVGCLTEFVDGPLELDVPESAAPRDVLRALNAQLAATPPRTVRAPSCRVVTYGRFDLHRGPVARLEETRLLVRVTESDLVRPRA